MLTFDHFPAPGDSTYSDIPARGSALSPPQGISPHSVVLPPGIALFFFKKSANPRPFPGLGLVHGRFERHIKGVWIKSCLYPCVYVTVFVCTQNVCATTTTRCVKRYDLWFMTKEVRECDGELLFY